MGRIFGAHAVFPPSDIRWPGKCAKINEPNMLWCAGKRTSDLKQVRHDDCDYILDAQMAWATVANVFT